MKELMKFSSRYSIFDIQQGHITENSLREKKKFNYNLRTAMY